MNISFWRGLQIISLACAMLSLGIPILHHVRNNRKTKSIKEVQIKYDDHRQEEPIQNYLELQEEAMKSTVLLHPQTMLLHKGESQ